MAHQPTPPQSQRIGVLTTVVAPHAALLVAFLASGDAAAPPLAKPGVLSLMSISANLPAVRPPPPPVLPSKLVDEIERLTEQALTIDPDSTALAAVPGQCATLELVSKAIVDDPSAVQAVVHAPPETRSIAEAIVLWNAGWSYAASTPDAPLGPPQPGRLCGRCLWRGGGGVQPPDRSVSKGAQLGRCAGKPNS